jgi:ribonuclease Z
LYSNWLWHQPLQLVVDAGEGLALALGSGVFSPSIVALTHGHSDHVLGLPGFAGARRFGKGAQSKEWTVIYPRGSSGVEAVRQTIAHLWPGVAFPISWIALGPHESHASGGNRSIQAVPVRHVVGEPAMAYRVLESRRRLKADFADSPPSDVERLSRQHGRDYVMEQFEHVVFAHSGDAMPIDAALVAGADLLVHDATFLAAAERREPIHASSDEVFALAREAGVRALVLNHLSVRYDRRAAHAKLSEQLTASGYPGPCWWLDEGEFVQLR